MDNTIKSVLEKQIKHCISALEKNNMKGFYAPTKADALKLVESLLPEGGTVAFGGSMTLGECGIMDLIRGGKYNLLDRYAPGLSKEEVGDVFAKSFSADAYLCSSNAVTLDGVLYNVDGHSNRVAAICFGPKSVIMVVGCQKIVPTIQDAAKRVKSLVAPANCARLNLATPCKETGVCIALDDDEIGSGCKSDTRICCNFVISGKQRIKDRIKVILVGEEVGY